MLISETTEQNRATNDDWPRWAHEAQRAPEGDWLTWLFLGGRGAGKTRAGAEWLRARSRPAHGASP